MWAVDAGGLSRSFLGKPVLDGLSLQVARGEMLAIVGENGSGKTTLLRVLATLLELDSGDAMIFGVSVRKGAAEVRRRIAWCPSSDAGFFPRLTGRENLLFFSSLRGISPSLLRDRLESHRGFVPLQKALESPFFLSSSGMKQALALTRALVTQPLLLLLDEPMRGLDDGGRRRLMEHLAAVRGDTTVLLTTHHPGEFQEGAARIVRLEGGKIRC
jgi:ABC-2 type transport system ATP-binding protein